MEGSPYSFTTRGRLNHYAVRWHKMSCACVDVDFGTYANAVPLYPPVQIGITRVPVTVDRCIAEEVQDLWSRGIVTTGNCCGHNQGEAFISVRDEDIPLMTDLGYVARRSASDDSAFVFYPKTLSE